MTSPWVTHFGFTRTPFGKNIPAAQLFVRDAHAEAWSSPRIVYAHPTDLGLYQLVGTVKAPRPHQWRHQPGRAG